MKTKVVETVGAVDAMEAVGNRVAWCCLLSQDGITVLGVSMADAGMVVASRVMSCHVCHVMSVPSPRQVAEASCLLAFPCSAVAVLGLFLPWVA